MKLTIAAIGKIPNGPETTLTDDYLTRFNRTGRALGLGPATLVAADAKKSTPSAEATVLKKHHPAGNRLVVLDERGKLLTSPDFATQLASWRDDDNRDITFMIGGADGLDPELRQQADFSLSFGKMVWPHQLARIMLCEQIYRAATILAGSPYHRS